MDDDQLLQLEGIDNLTEEELREASFERGLQVLPLSMIELQLQLKEWILLSTLRPNFLSSLLIYVHVFLVPKDLHLYPNDSDDQIQI